jgi:hypothetical protein
VTQTLLIGWGLIQSTRTMVGRALRAAIGAALVFVVLAFSRSALAAPAPFCDDRGATALAAPPALEAAGDAIQRARFSTCDYGHHHFETSVGPMRHRITPASDDAGQALLPPPAQPPPFAIDMLEVNVVVPRPCVGVRIRVERPPRG